MNENNFIHENVRLRNWIRYELAARKIQRNFRQWRKYVYFHRHMKLNAIRRLQRNIGVSSIQTSSIFHSFKAVMQQTADNQDKFVFWRQVIDLRRSFPDFTPDLLIKALMEAKGDINRAQTLLGNKEFYMQNHEPPLPSTVRAMCIPTVGPFDTLKPSPYDIKFVKALIESTNKYTATIVTNQTNAEMFETGEFNIDQQVQQQQQKSRNIDFIRSLRNQHLQKRKQELMGIFSKVLEKSLFPQITMKTPNKTGQQTGK
jgi:hypothetical protein